MSIKWFEVAKVPPPFETDLLVRGIDSGTYYKWNNETKSRETSLSEFSRPYFDIGKFLEKTWRDIDYKYATEGNWKNKDYPYYYDSSGISADKNTYELWREINNPTHWAYLD